MDWSPRATADLPPDFIRRSIHQVGAGARSTTTTRRSKSPGYFRGTHRAPSIDMRLRTRRFAAAIVVCTIYQFDPNGRLCYYYAHLERYAGRLHEGQTVSRGQVIGYEGSTGSSTGPHVHFMVLYQNGWVDPMNYVQLP